MSELRPAGPLEGRIVRIEPMAERHREVDVRWPSSIRKSIAIRGCTRSALTAGSTSRGFDSWFDLALASEHEVPFVVHVAGKPAGSTRYMNVEPFHKRMEIGWTWLEPAHWGTGANVETKHLLLENALERWQAMRVEFKTDARNERVRSALLGIGCRFEGVFHKHMSLPDAIRDSAWYAIVDDDWPRV